MPRHVIAFGFVSVLELICHSVFPLGTSGQEPAPSRYQPGWPEVFTGLDGYVVTYQKPVVGKGEKPDTFQQTAIYLWSGGRDEVLEITLARDPAFRLKYSAEALKNEKSPPKELEVNKRKAWQWDFPREVGKADQVVRRLVVLLDVDKAIMFEQKGSGPTLEHVAKKFDFAKVDKALANPPKR
jgi:hypothetical protein